MNQKNAQQIRAGVFVSLGVLVMLFLLFVLGDFGAFWKGPYRLVAEFDKADGLRSGAPVFLAGIKVGKVDSVAFSEKPGSSKVEVNLDVDQDFSSRIRQDSQASIVTQGLLGDKAVLITMGSPESPVLPEGGALATVEAFSISSLAKGGTELLDNLNELVKSLRSGEGLVSALLYDPKGKELLNHLSQVSARASRMMREVEKGEGLLHALVYSDEKGQLAQTLKNFRLISEDFKKLSAQIEAGEGSVGGLIQDPTVYHNLMTLLGGANRSKLLRSVIRSTMAKNERDTIGKSSKSTSQKKSKTNSN